LHVVASQSPVVSPMVEYFVNYMPDKTHFQKNPPQTRNGWIDLPTRPGFGIELDEQKITQTVVLPAV
jgi:L-rhamnonate dehydratase